MTTTNVVQLSSITPHPSVEYWSVCKVEALFETENVILIGPSGSGKIHHYMDSTLRDRTEGSIFVRFFGGHQNFRLTIRTVIFTHGSSSGKTSVTLERRFIC